MPITSARRAGRTGRPGRHGLVVGLLLVVATSAPTPAQPPAAAPARNVPQTLNFANGLFRERRYDLAAKEYERFLAEGMPDPADAVEARFGLANARLFQGEYARARSEFEAFLAQAPRHPNAGSAQYRVGETAYMLGDLPAARKAFEAFVSGHPGHKHLDTAWPYLGDVCLRTGDLPAARKAYEAALSTHPEGRLADRARFGLGRTLALQGETDKALAAFVALASKGGRDWADRAWFQAGQIQTQAGRSEDAAASFEKVVQLAGQGPLADEARLNRAEALARLGRREEAEGLLKTLTANPSQGLAAQAALALGGSRLEAGDAAGAIAMLDDAAARFAKTPLAPALLFRSAEAALKLDRKADAQARFLKAAEADPKDPWADDALLRAARLALDEHDQAAAERLAGTFAERFPTSPLKADARLVAGRAALAAGRSKESVSALEKALSDDKPSTETAATLRYYLALAYQADNQAEKAAAVLGDLAKAPDAGIAADARFLLGQGQIEAGRFAEAAATLEAYLAARPRGDVADFALGYLVQARLELNDAEAASKALDRLAADFPKSKVLAASRLRMGESALKAKQFDQAIERFRQAAESPEAEPAVSARARLGLGWAQLDGGHPADAASAFAAFIEARPDDPLAAEAALARARALEAAGQQAQALEAYTLAASKYPGTAPADHAALASARLLVELKRPAEAADAYARFVKEHPEYKPSGPSSPGPDAVLSEWGWALIDADKPAEADTVFKRLLHDHPESPHAADARFNLAESANLANRPDEVLDLLGPLAAPGAKVPPRLGQSVLYRLGRTQAELKRWPEAAQTLDRLLTDFPETTYRREARLLRAEVALESGDTQAADTILSALSAEPTQSSDPAGFALAVRRRRVQALLGLKKWSEVVATAEAVLKDAPEGPHVAELHFARGRALQQMASWDAARAAYRAAIAARKGGELAARAQFMIGETYFHQKDYAEAIRQFLMVEVLHDAPTWQAAALLETGKAYERLSQWADAAETYKRLRTRFPNEPSAAEALTRLEAVGRQQKGAAGERPKSGL